MPKCRQAIADALARLFFEKPLAELDRSERAELNFLRALDGDAADEERYGRAIAGSVCMMRRRRPFTSRSGC
jgi:hypothetical protein